MKRAKFLAGMAALACLAMFCERGAAAAESEQVSLNGDWDFTYTAAAADAVPTPPAADAFKAQMAVPGWWDAQLERINGAPWFQGAKFVATEGPVKYLSGIGWHRKTFDAPAEWKGRAATLTVGRAPTIVNVWLNGKHVGGYDYGLYTPFELDLTDKLNYGGRNELLIAVDNTRGVVQGSWATIGAGGMASGITQPVTLNVAAGPGKIADLFVRAGKTLEDVLWTAELAVPAGEKRAPASRIEWSISQAKGGAPIASGKEEVAPIDGMKEIAWETNVDGIKPWSDREPNLYWTTVRWVGADGNLLDEQVQRFGIRRMSTEGRRLLLNGKPIYMRGSFGNYTHPLHGPPPTDKEYWRAHIRTLKELGFNYINFAAQVCPAEMMEAADEEGMILQCGDHQTVLADYRKYSEEIWNPIVRCTRRNPSLIIYGFGGERDYYEGIIEQYQAQHDLIKKLSPDAMVMPQQAIRGIDYAFDEQGAKELTEKPFPHHAARLVRYTRATDIFGHYSGGALSYTYDKPPHWQDMDERFRIYDRPLSQHEVFMGASYLNPENAARYTGRIPAYLHADTRKQLTEAGMLDKWPVYFENSARLQALGVKYNLEKIRKCHELVAFEFLGTYDMQFMPHYTVGILDEFMNVKPGTDRQSMLNVNDENVLLIDYDGGESINRAYYEGEAFSADALLSMYGAEDLKNGTMTWTLARDGKQAAGGKLPVAEIATGRVATLGKVELTWPDVEATARYNLKFRLEGNIVPIENEWDFWVFPRRETPAVDAAADEATIAKLGGRYKELVKTTDKPDARLRIVPQMSDDDLQHLRQGGDVLLLGTKPFITHGYSSWRSGLGGRPHHNIGTVIADSPIFADLPNEGWADWQFYYILDGAPPFLIDEEELGGYDPILEVISPAGSVRKQATIFERRVGKGRLLASSCVINMNNPACVALLDGMVKYVASEKFAPKLTIDHEIVAQGIEGPPAGEPGNLLQNADFDRNSVTRAVWNPYGEGYTHDREEFHRGHGAIRIEITPEQAAKAPGMYVGASTLIASAPENAGPMRMSAWCKTDSITGEEGLDLLMYGMVTYQNGQSETVRMILPVGTNDWQLVEHRWEPANPVRGGTFFIGMIRKTGTLWVDDVYFGPAQQAAVEAPAEEAPQWSNQPVKMTFGADDEHRVDDSDWSDGTMATVSREGITRVATRTRANPEPRIREVRIDITPPRLELTAEPALDQAGGVYTGSAATRLRLAGQDALSGVAKIEYSIDGGDYQEFREPFRLAPGRHILRARATDRAGNSVKMMSGDMLTGGETEAATITIE